MAQLACRDLGMDCNEVITGATADEVKQKSLAHAQAAHADMLRSMSSPEQMAQMMQLIESKIR